jgi:hypothetical protein
MIRQLDKPPEGNYRRAKLLVRLGALMPAGREGWVSEEAIEQDKEGCNMYKFISATNHDLTFKVYAEEVKIH